MQSLYLGTTEKWRSDHWTTVRPPPPKYRESEKLGVSDFWRHKSGFHFSPYALGQARGIGFHPGTASREKLHSPLLETVCTGFHGQSGPPASASVGDGVPWDQVYTHWDVKSPGGSVTVQRGK